MIILLILIFLLLSGVIAFDAITTVAGGVIAGVILLIFFIVRASKRRADDARSNQGGSIGKWVIVVLFLALTFWVIPQDAKAVLLIVVAVIVIGGIVRSIINADKKERESIEQEALIQDQGGERQSAATDEHIENQAAHSIAFPAEVNGVPAAYRYEKVHIQLSDNFQLESYVGSPVTFQASEEKTAVVLSGVIVGFIASGRIASMVKDWLSRNHPVLAYFTSADDEKREYAIDIVFYRDQFRHLLERHPDAKKYKLTGNRSEEMQRNIGDLKEGQRLALEYDYEKEKYAVLDGWKIGYLPASAEKIVEEYGQDDVNVFVAGTEIDDDFVTAVYVYVFD